MKLFQRITLALMGCMLLSTPAMAADYSFETKAPADYYGSTAYEEVYGAQYNYGGQNAVDFLDPLADSAPSPLAGNTIEYGIGSSSGSIYPDGTSNDYPLQWGGPSVTPVTAFTPVSDVEQANGSIGTLSIPAWASVTGSMMEHPPRPCGKVWGTSPARAHGAGTLVCVDTIGAPAIISALLKIWRSVMPSAMRQVWEPAPIPSAM